MCPMDVKPFELILAIRKWQSTMMKQEFHLLLLKFIKGDNTQAVGMNVKLRKSLGLPELKTITSMPEQMKLYQEMLMKTPVVKENDYMFKEE